MTHKTKILIILGLVLVLLSGGVFAHEMFRQKILWSPKVVNLPSLAPGSSTSTVVTFTNSSLFWFQKIKGEHLAIRVTNGAGVSIQTSARFPKVINPGQRVPVTLTVSVDRVASATPPRVIPGQLQLVRREEEENDYRHESEREKTKEKTIGLPLTVNTTISSFFLPPEPDPILNNSTPLGIDTSGRRIRDDVYRYIGFTFPNSEKAREGLLVYAQQDQKLLADFLATAGDPTEQKRVVRADAVESEKAGECLDYTLGSNKNTVGVEAAKQELKLYIQIVDISKKLKAQFLNTTDRQVAYHHADELLAGTGGGGEEWDPKTLCKELGFDPDSLPN